MLKQTLASLILATSLLGGCADKTPQVIAVPTAELQQPGTMTVTGTATLQVSPDCADLTMTISADAVRAGQATADVQRKQQELVAALMSLGIENADIKLSYLTLNPVYAQTPTGAWTNKVASYRADITITVTTHKFDRIGAIMEAGANAGASAMSSQFRRSDLVELKKKVREMALLAAKEKAAQTAATLGVPLGRIVNVAEAPAGNLWRTQYLANAMSVRDNGGGNAIGGTLETLTLDITLGFELPRRT